MTRWEKQMFEVSFTQEEINRLANTKSYYAGTCGGVDLYLKRGLMYKVKSIVRSIVRFAEIQRDKKVKSLC